MYPLFLSLHVIIAISLITIVLLQQGKGADAGAAFGSGASSTVFGARGSGSFLTRVTTGLAIAFFVNCMVLAYFATRTQEPTSVVESIQETKPQSDVPLVPDSQVPTDVPQLPESSTE